MAITRAEVSRIAEQQAARDSVLSGHASEWPAVDGGELVMIDGVMKPASTIANLPTSARIEQGLMHEIGAALKILKIRLPRGAEFPKSPVRAEDYEPGQRASARKLNQLVLRLRDVQHRSDQLIQAEEAAARGRREKHVLALRQLLDEAPPKLRARAEAIGDLGVRAKRISQFLEDIAILAGAVHGAAHERKLCELLTEGAAILNEPTPRLPQSQLPPDFTLPVEKLAMLLGVPPAARAVDGHLVKSAQAAVTALRSA